MAYNWKTIKLSDYIHKVGQKLDHLKRLQLLYTMTQKGDP